MAREKRGASGIRARDLSALTPTEERILAAVEAAAGSITTAAKMDGASYTRYQKAIDIVREKLGVRSAKEAIAKWREMKAEAA